MKKIRMARDGYVLISIIFYIVGIVCMTIPSISPLVLCITGGIILVAYGIVKIIGYLSDDLYLSLIHISDKEQAVREYCDAIFDSGADAEQFFYRLGLRDGIRLQKIIKNILKKL